MNNHYHRIVNLCVCLIAMISMSAVATAGIGDEYSFATSNTSYTSITGSTALGGTTSSTYGTFNESAVAGPFNIGFDFTFGCTTYSRFTVATSGHMILGTSTNGQVSNNLTGSNAYPIIAPFWDQMHLYDGNCSPSIDPSIGVYYTTTGSSPNRVLTVEWRVQFNSGGTYYWYNCTNGPLLRFKVHLYEGSNRIDFVYGPAYQGLALSATVGIAESSNDYISVTPGSNPTTSSTTANNSWNIASTGMTSGTVYSFIPEKLVVEGRTGPGNEGVADPVDGSTLLSDVLTYIGTTNGYTPLDLRKPCAAPTIGLQMSISGQDASAYTFNATGTQQYNASLSTNAPLTPQIDFAPFKGGVHDAVLTVQSQLTGKSVSFNLAAESETRIEWIGHIAEGGTPGVQDGDTLLDGKRIVFGNGATWRPLTLANLTSPGVAPPAVVNYVLNDPTGSYAIDMTSDAIDGGEESTVAISYDATHGVGYQQATLEVSVDGETRTYLLRAFTSAPGGELFVNGAKLDSTSHLFVDRYSCVGATIVQYEVTAVNTGTGDFEIEGLEAYGTDTVIQQGTPRYPLLFDAFGDPVPYEDFFLSLGSNVTGPEDRIASTIVVPEGQQRVFYLNFRATRPAKRFAQLFIQTNGFNLNDEDVFGSPTQGLVKIHAFPRGMGSLLANVEGDKRPDAVAFGRTEVRESRELVAWIYNHGDCDLTINRKEFRLFSGDIADFEILEVLPNTRVDGDYYVLPPGAGDSVRYRFTPESYGSRRASIRLVTNDSTLGGNGVIERGVYYLDVYGVGSIGLEVRDLTLHPAVIDGPSSSGAFFAENTSNVPLAVESVTIDDPNGEFAEDPSRPWPALPVVIQPGESMTFGVRFTPDPAIGEGNRTVSAEFAVTGSDPAIVSLSAYAGTRVLEVVPGSLFQGAEVTVGDIRRQYVFATNSGTLPLRIDDPVLSGPDAGDYSVQPLVRRTLEPGQSEIIEVSFTPTSPGMKSAQVLFPGNSTQPDPVVQLGGEGTSSNIRHDDPGSNAEDSRTVPNSRMRAQESHGMDLSLYPVPCDESATLLLPSPDAVKDIRVYDGSGRMVWSIDGNDELNDDGSVALRTSEWSVGTYTVVCVGQNEILTRRFQVVR